MESPKFFEEIDTSWICPLAFDDRAITAIAKIGSLHGELIKEAADFEYQQVIAEQKAHYVSEITEDSRLYPKYLAKIALAQVYERGDPVQLLKTLGRSRTLVIVHLLNAAKSELQNGNLMVPLICFRAIIEHCAYFHDAIRKLDISEAAASFSAAEQQLKVISEQLGKLLLGTRFDWWSVDGLNLDETSAKLVNKKYEYKFAKDSHRFDMKAQQVMTAIDRFEKVVPEIRGVYELLCEFAHPNLGALYTITSKTISGVDKQGIHWTSRTIGLGPPEIHQSISSLFTTTFMKVTEVLEAFAADQEQLCQLKTKYISLTQLCVRHDVKTRNIDVDKYAECPCGSSIKFKYCCHLK